MNARNRCATDSSNGQRLSCRSPIMALHCSGADGCQWSWLKSALVGSATILTPDLIGTPTRGPWHGTRDFRLSFEAEEIIEQLVSLREPAHVVGHSFGAALSLHIARERPDLVRSLCLYEPTLFCLLNNDNETDRALFQEINSLTLNIMNRIEDDHPDQAAKIFTDFWSGQGTWQALKYNRRAALVDWIAKAPLDFEALLNEPTSDPFFCVSKMPVKLMVGGNTHKHTTRIFELLSAQCISKNAVTLQGAGHLGPFTHRESFEREVLTHIQLADV